MSQLYNFANFAFNNPPPPPSDLDAYLDHLRLATLYLPGLSSLTLSPSETTVFKNGLQTVQRWLDRLPDAALSEFAEWLSPAARARLDAPAPPLSFGAATLLAPAPTTASPERDKAALVIYQPPLLRESTPLFLKADAEGEESGTADGIAEMEDVEITGARAVTPVRTVVVKTEPLDHPSSAQVEDEEVDELGSFLASPSPPAPKVATRTVSKAANKATPKAPPPLRSAAAIRASVAFVADRPGREVRPPIVKEEETGELGELQAISCTRCATMFQTKFACYALDGKRVYDPENVKTYRRCYKCTQDRYGCDFKGELEGPFFTNPAPDVGAPAAPADTPPRSKRAKVRVPSVSPPPTRTVRTSTHPPVVAPEAESASRPSKRPRTSPPIYISVPPMPSGSRAPSSSGSSSARDALDTLEHEFSDWKIATRRYERASEQALRQFRLLAPADAATPAPESSSKSSKGKGKQRAE